MAFLFSNASRSKGMRRSTLRAMMRMDAAVLSDMGLTHYDIAEALRGGASAGQILDARRSARASEWLQ